MGIGPVDLVIRGSIVVVANPEGLELAELFPKIRRSRVRRRVLDLVRSMAEEESAPEADD